MFLALSMPEGIACQMTDKPKDGKMSQISLKGSSEAAPRSSAGDVAAFVAKTKLVRKAQQSEGRGLPTGRLIFALDATMSRQPTWDLACSLQSDMFVEAQVHGGLAAQLVYFRGVGECCASRWTNKAKDMTGWMERFECRAGRTQLGRILQHIQNESAKHGIQAAVYVGDCLEEDPDHIVGMAGEVALRGVPVFVFQEGSDPFAETIFRDIARMTGGAYAKFDAGARERLAAYLRAVAAFAASGQDQTYLPKDLQSQIPRLSGRK
jgi:hypothetical protein